MTPLASRIQILSELSVLRTCSWQGWIVFFKLCREKKKNSSKLFFVLTLNLKMTTCYVIKIFYFIFFRNYTNYAIDHVLQRQSKRCRHCRTGEWSGGNVLHRGRTGAAAWRRYRPIPTKTDLPSGRHFEAMAKSRRVRTTTTRGSATSSILTSPLCWFYFVSSHHHPAESKKKKKTGGKENELVRKRRIHQRLSLCQ